MGDEEYTTQSADESAYSQDTSAGNDTLVLSESVPASDRGEDQVQVEDVEDSSAGSSSYIDYDDMKNAFADALREVNTEQEAQEEADAAASDQAEQEAQEEADAAASDQAEQEAQEKAEQKKNTEQLQGSIQRIEQAVTGDSGTEFSYQPPREFYRGYDQSDSVYSYLAVPDSNSYVASVDNLPDYTNIGIMIVFGLGLIAGLIFTKDWLWK